MKFILICLVIWIPSHLAGFNVGYLNSDYGIPLSVDRYQWNELEKKGRTVLGYDLDGFWGIGDWIGISFVAVERDDLPSACLDRLSYEFEQGAEKINLFVLKKNSDSQLFRLSTSDYQRLRLTNSLFVVEYNGLYRKYSEKFERRTEKPILRSESSKNRIEILMFKYGSKTVSERDLDDLTQLFESSHLFRTKILSTEVSLKRSTFSDLNLTCRDCRDPK